ncbi:hypothetical protein LOTGIDRAFT_164189 [Lottia gigantea]|uniref:Uncharacterized protein n=1 Tax=Lottia gigantea TaxID=225164 RepID=V4AAD0_LOTGI|nr:hypothetical protein LOTGIDRAFT_164189 [Lottia gigantea]ESO90266.1 hypothetical protein LOTGIDRAFT_164189 [Lottia gigantea]
MANRQMGKNKKGKKNNNNTGDKTKVSRIKKLKAKPVAKNLKRLNQINKAQTEDLDKGYDSFRHKVIKTAQDGQKSQQKPVTQKVKPKREERKPEPDIDVAMEDFSKL